MLQCRDLTPEAILRAVLASVYVATALLLAASLIVGRALFAALGTRQRSWLEPAAGFALLIVAARLAIRLPGRATTSVVVLAALVVASVAYLVVSRRPLARSASGLFVPVAVALVVLAAVSIPFLANDRVGLLGVGRQSDLQAHVYAADFLTTHVGFPPDAIGNGYPLGPHALVATLAKPTGIGTEAAFLGLILAIPILTAWTALTALGELPAGRRIAAAALVGLPYLLTSFLGEGIFKETAEGLYLVAFALALRELRFGRISRPALVATAIALAGASVYTYSYPGLAWPAATLVIWAVLELIGGWRPRWPLSRRPSRRAVVLGGACVVALLAIAIPEAHRISNFSHTVSFVEGTKGRLRAPISPAQALGLWPSGNFRIDPGDAALAMAMALAALGALVFGVLWWLRRRDLAVPAALVAATLIYLEAHRRSGLYIEAKALAILAPLPMLISLRALLAGRNLVKLLIAVAICAGAGASTFMALRDAPVGPRAHGDELARFRPLVAGHTVLFLGLDRFSQHELRGSYLRQGNLLIRKGRNPNKRWLASDALDFDSVDPRRLDRFDYAITTSAAFASQPPANFRRIAATRDFLLFKREGPTAPRSTLAEGSSIGARLDCSTPAGAALARRRGGAAIIDPPVIGPKTRWAGGPFFESGGSATQILQLPPGEWQLSLQYNSPVTLTVLGQTLPASLDGEVPHFEGSGPFWPAGSVRGGRLKIAVRAAGLNWLQRLLGVHRRVALGEITATSAKPERIVPLSQACGRFVDWYEPLP